MRLEFGGDVADSTHATFCELARRVLARADELGCVLQHEVFELIRVSRE
ncbi:hypothetical protein [Gaiella sp.]|nr:hypothetical protein [Gaiella sp.]HEX5584718.1 hypothetical protein [Gaiella sp.]